MKSFFSNKGSLGPNIKLVEKNELPQNDREIANELNTFFKNTVSNLEINENPYIINQVSDDVLDSVEKFINKYQFHPGILLELLLCITCKIGLTFKICFYSIL